MGLTIGTIALNSDNDGLSRVPFLCVRYGPDVSRVTRFLWANLVRFFVVRFCPLGEFGMGKPMAVPIGVSLGGGLPLFCTYCSLLTSIGVSVGRLGLLFIEAMLVLGRMGLFRKCSFFTWGFFLRRGLVSCRVQILFSLFKGPFFVCCSVRVLISWRNIFP